jgi:hypothetical protein
MGHGFAVRDARPHGPRTDRSESIRLHQPRRAQTMTQAMTPGAKLRLAVQEERPLQVVGAINAYHARMAERTGYRALYLSGGGVAAGSYGLPDLGMTSLDNVLEDVAASPISPTAAAGGCRHRLGQRLQHRPHRQATDPRRGRRLSHRGSGRRPSAAATVPARRSSPGRDGRPHQGRRGRAHR